MERDLAAGRMAVEIHLEPRSEMVAVASAELFATVAEIVVVVDGAVDAKLADEMSDEMVDEVADAGGAVADEVIDAAEGAAGATSDEVFDEQGTRREPVLGERNFHLVMLVAGRYLADMSVSRQTACSSADCFGRKYCRHSQRKC